VLGEARALGLDRVLLTATLDNTASARLIESAGGQGDGTPISPNTGETMLRYWIEFGGRRAG
jgi:predicted acetyltransferase